jgi:type I restriction enzyme M protein
MPVLSQQQLQTHLWESANILRGSIDSSDYKNYIFGMLFLKRLSDVFDDEVQAVIERETASGTPPDEAQEIAEDPDEHQFYVPERARWANIRAKTFNIGEAIYKAFFALEERNSALAGVLTPIDFNNKERLPDVTLLKLIAHFNKVRLGHADIPNPDMLGDAYMYLIAQFADDAGKKGGEFYTPRQVVRLIVELLKPTEGMVICDPTAGSGGMLLESLRYVRESGGNPRNVRLFGQEKNLNTWAICKMNMLLHGLPDAVIARGDTIREPKLIGKDGGLMLFNRVLANPPFSLKQWGREEAEHDAYGRFGFGLPPASYGDLAFVQHMIATLTLDGMCGVVMPHGVLFRGNKERDIRQGILDRDWLEAVIGLPPNLFYGTGIPAAVLIFNKAKRSERRGLVMFIHAAEGFEAGTNQNLLRETDIRAIVNAFDGWADIERYCRVVRVEEIRENDYNLNIPRYVDTVEPEEQVDLAAAIAAYQEAVQAREAAEARLNEHLRRLGLTPP